MVQIFEFLFVEINFQNFMPVSDNHIVIFCQICLTGFIESVSVKSVNISFNKKNACHTFGI